MATAWVRVTLFGAILSSMTGGGASAPAAEKYEVGEKIEVFFLNSWIPAEVVETNSKGMVRAKYSFANREQIEIFRPDAVRHEYESGAIWRGRIWSDASETYKIKAALLKVEPDRITLRTEDKRELKVEIAKLRESDQTFLRKLREEAGGGVPLALAPAPVRFDVTSVRTPAGGRSTGSPARQVEVASSGFRLEPDPQRASLQLKQAGVPIPEGAPGDYLGSVIPLGGADAWLLAGIENSYREKVPTRVMWASLAKSSVGGKQSFPAGETILDYHAPSKQLLTYAAREDEGERTKAPILTIWTAQPAAKEAQGIIAWQARLRDEDRIGHAEPWARFVTGSLVVQRDSSHRLIAWDVAQKRAAWSTPQESFFAPRPVLSHNGKYLFLPEDRRLRILNPIDGAELGQVTTKDKCSAVALHADGKTLAVLASHTLLLIDLTGASPIREITADAIGTPFATNLDWVTDQLIAVPRPPHGLILFSLEHAVPVWTYEFDSDVYRVDSRSGRTRSLVGGHLAYAAKPLGREVDYIVGAVKFPEERVIQLLGTIDRQSFMLMGPGTRVRTSVSAGANDSAVRAAVAQQVAANQWVEDPSAEYSLTAKIYQGQTQTVTYERFSTGERMSVTSTPIVSEYTIQRGTDTLWTNATASGIPPILHLKEGQNVQTEAGRWQNPDIEFFTRSDIPHELFDPAKQGGLGVTDISVRGLVPRK